MAKATLRKVLLSTIVLATSGALLAAEVEIAQPKTNESTWQNFAARLAAKSAIEAGMDGLEYWSESWGWLREGLGKLNWDLPAKLSMYQNDNGKTVWKFHGTETGKNLAALGMEEGMCYLEDKGLLAKNKPCDKRVEFAKSVAEELVPLTAAIAVTWKQDHGSVLDNQRCKRALLRILLKTLSNGFFTKAKETFLEEGTAARRVADKFTLVKMLERVAPLIDGKRGTGNIHKLMAIHTGAMLGESTFPLLPLGEDSWVNQKEYRKKFVKSMMGLGLEPFVKPLSNKVSGLLSCGVTKHKK